MSLAADGVADCVTMTMTMSHLVLPSGFPKLFAALASCSEHKARETIFCEMTGACQQGVLPAGVQHHGKLSL